MFPSVFTLCFDIVMQSMKINGLLGVTVGYCDPTASQHGGNSVHAFLLAVGSFVMQMV